MDPAGPAFENYDNKRGLFTDCASFVDVLHTHGKDGPINYGTMKVLGHMDFYPNGGGYQPGCTGRRNSKPHCQQSYYDIEVSKYQFIEKLFIYAM